MYLIQVSICWILFFALYYLAFKRLTFFNHNRWYLLTSLTLGLVLPIIAPYITIYKPDVFTTYINKDVLSSIVIIQNDEIDPAYYSYKDIAMMVLWAVYLSGVMFLLMRMWYGLQQIYIMYTRGQKQQKNGIELVQLDSDMLPFSFFNRVFFGRKFNEKELESVMKHELVHINQRHTYDILFVEVLKCFFWFNPIIGFYKKSLKQAHEYIADHFTTHGSLDREYIHLLLNTSMSSLQQELTNQFFNTEIKNRIDMMIRIKSAKSKLLNYILVLPTLLMVGYAFASNAVTYIEENNILNLKENQIIPENNNLFTLNTSLQNGYENIDDYFSILDPKQESTDKAIGLVKDKTPARFYTEAETQDELPVADKEKVSLDKFLRFIYTTIKYPGDARKDHIKGLSIVEFTVGVDGKIKNVKMQKSIKSSLDAACIELIQAMNKLPHAWIPAMADGKAVESKISLPIFFKLQGSELPINNQLTHYLESSIIISEIEKYGKVSYLKTPIIVTGYGENKEILFDGEENYHILKDGKKINLTDLKDLNKKDIQALEVSPASNSSKGTIRITSKGIKSIQDEKLEKFSFEPNIDSYVKKDTTRWKEVYLRVDGVHIEGTTINDIDPNEIKSVSVFKGKSLKEKNIPEGYTSLVEVTTKKNAKSNKVKKDNNGKTTVKVEGILLEPDNKKGKEFVAKKMDEIKKENIHIIIDEVVKTQEEMDKLDPNEIREIQVFKGNLDTFKLEKEVDGVVKITTKNAFAAKTTTLRTEEIITTKTNLEASFYPNPAATHGMLKIKTDDTKTPITVIIYDSAGKELFKLVITDHNGLINEEILTYIEIKGVSTMFISQGNTKTSLKIMKK